MSDKNREYEEFLKKYADKSLPQPDGIKKAPAKPEPPVKKKEPPKKTSKKTAPEKSGNTSLHFKKIADKSKFRRQTVFAALIVAMIVLGIVIAVICKSCVGKSDVSALQGKWRYDEYTVYEFDSEGNGCMVIDGTNRYDFKYSVDGDKLKLDFALNYVKDCEYDFKCEKSTLTLIGGEGTVEIGKEYVLKPEQQ